MAHRWRSSRDTYLQKLRQAGMVEKRGDLIFALQAGLDALGTDYKPLPTGAELQDYWIARLPEGERKILQVLIDAHPRNLDRSEIDALTGYKRSSRDTYLQKLRSRRLVEMDGTAVRASERLFQKDYFNRSGL